MRVPEGCGSSSQEGEETQSWGVPEGHRLSSPCPALHSSSRPCGKCVLSFKGDDLKSREHHHQSGTYSIFCPSNASGLFVGVFDFRDWSRNLYFTLNCIQLLLKQRALPAQEIQSYPKALRNVVAVFKCLPPSQASLCQGHPRLTNTDKRITSPMLLQGNQALKEKPAP